MKSPLVVGVVSHQDGETIGAVTAALRDGMARHFADLDSRVVLADTGSGDGSTARARDALAGSVELVELPVVRSTGELLERPALAHLIPGAVQRLLRQADRQRRRLGDLLRHHSATCRITLKNRVHDAKALHIDETGLWAWSAGLKRRPTIAASSG